MQGTKPGTEGCEVMAVGLRDLPTHPPRNPYRTSDLISDIKGDIYSCSDRRLRKHLKIKPEN
jgi:hypothetical protein